MNIGNGTHEYEVLEQWAKIPTHVTMGYTHGIEVDSHDNVYVFHTGKPSMLKFSKNGEFISSWGEEFEGGAHGFYLHQEADSEYFYVTDTKKGLVVKMTLEGESVLTIVTPDLPNVYDSERRFIPTDVCVAPNGDIYVCDGYGQHWIHQYDANGTPIRSWGGKGSEPGQMICPHGISINLRGTEPEIYVADRGNNRIQVFTLEGVHKRFITDDMDMPCNFYFDGDDMFFPDLHSRVTIFDGNDHLNTHLGEDQQAYKQTGWPNLPLDYFQPDKFSSPHGICVDSQHNVYVAEWTQFGRITKLVRK
jgi:DNA-binding beta-propeller fold protein YncE